MAFDPDAFLANEVGFDPDAFLAGSQLEAPTVEPVEQQLSAVDRFLTPLDGASQSERMLQMVKSVPRAAGLMARTGIEGGGELLEFAGTPIRAGMQYAGFNDPAGGGKALADYLNLPKADDSGERVVSDIGRIMVGGGGILGAAGKMQKLTGTAQGVGKSLAVRPDLQLASAVGSGTAGGIAKESNGDPLTQVIASVFGGIAAPIAASGAQKTVTGMQNLYKAMTKDPQFKDKIDLVIETALKSKGITMGQLDTAVRNKLVKDMKDTMKRGAMSPDVVRRLVDYRTTGLIPTAGPLTLDPNVVTRQKNLSKLGVSSKDPRLQRLSQIENENNKKLIDNLNQLGADKPGDKVSAGQRVIDALDEKSAAESSKINLLYKQARGTQGRSAQLDPSEFTQKAGNLLNDALLEGKLPSDVRNNLNKIAQGEIPLTVDVAEQFKTSIAGLQRATIDKSEKMALGLVRQALDDTPLMSGQDIGKDSIKAFNTARAANRAWMSKVDDVPALKAVLDGVDPDKFVNSYIIGTGKAASINNVMKLKNTIKDAPEAMGAVKNNLSQYLKDKALSGATDEVGNFSQSGYNKALKSIGNEKLSMFFNADEVKALKAIGRVASYEQLQPKGAAVNNSNTASATIAAVLDRIGGSSLLRKVPLGAEFVGDPLKSVSSSLEAKSMLNLPTIAKQTPSKSGLVLPPALAAYMMSNPSE